uniref:Uncharacterized protein n=1 Tax=Picea glauca TaxID=3330 RepID=A0A101M109_PICGL|nr:hypothetical protein ABT39_MTgene4268 [Picea glauca]
MMTPLRLSHSLTSTKGSIRWLITLYSASSWSFTTIRPSSLMMSYVISSLRPYIVTYYYSAIRTILHLLMMPWTRY